MAISILALTGCADDTPALAGGSSESGDGTTMAMTTAAPGTTSTGGDSTGTAGATGGSSSSNGTLDGTTAGSTSDSTGTDSSGSTDASTTDASTTDASTTDASTTDASTTDASTTDASTTDASSSGGSSSGGSSSTGFESTGFESTGFESTGFETDSGGPEPGPCCEATLTPSCADDEVAECVCMFDDFCCTNAWDLQCVDTAVSLCDLMCDGGDASCCNAHAGNGCEDPDCENAVCISAPLCCSDGWGSACAELANDSCEVCGGGGPGGSGDCCIANGTPGCEDPAIEACVCAIDGFCCDVFWDGICANEAVIDCDADC